MSQVAMPAVARRSAASRLTAIRQIAAQLAAIHLAAGSATTRSGRTPQSKSFVAPLLATSFHPSGRWRESSDGFHSAGVRQVGQLVTMVGMNIDLEKCSKCVEMPFNATDAQTGETGKKMWPVFWP